MAIDSKELETILNRHKRWLEVFTSSYARMIADAPTPAFYGGIQDAEEALPHFRADFSGADLQGANLSGADLTLAKFGGANLSGANFGKADLLNADLQNARLGKADFRNARLTEVDLTGADLTGAYLTGASLDEAKLTGANLTRALLKHANLARARLTGANLTGAQLEHAKLTRAELTGANLRGANLILADLRGAELAGAGLSDTMLGGVNLVGANLTRVQLSTAVLGNTIFGGCDLAEASGLDQCHHEAPSIIDFHTLQRSGPLPLAFLRGAGLPDSLIDYLPSLLNTAIQLYSCFISHSSKDQAFAERLHADLQNKGVRCWFAPHDMPIGAKIIDALDEAIRLRDKVLLILSEGAIASDWVESEVTRALDEERTRKQLVLVPLRIDDAVLQTPEAWARLLRGQRNIGDFTRWKEHDSYSQSFDRLMRDLRMKDPGARSGAQ
jgi:uncharacterized protein YjbI with pentapeptide repeats